jgi:hypothetical protein
VVRAAKKTNALRSAVSRRQMLEQAELGLGSSLLLLTSGSCAADETLNLPPIFHGNAPISVGVAVGAQRAGAFGGIAARGTGSTAGQPIAGVGRGGSVLATPAIYTHGTSAIRRFRWRFPQD